MNISEESSRMKSRPVEESRRCSSHRADAANSVYLAEVITLHFAQGCHLSGLCRSAEQIVYSSRKRDLNYSHTLTLNSILFRWRHVSRLCSFFRKEKDILLFIFNLYFFCSAITLFFCFSDSVMTDNLVCCCVFAELVCRLQCSPGTTSASGAS